MIDVLLVDEESGAFRETAGRNQRQEKQTYAKSRKIGAGCQGISFSISLLHSQISRSFPAFQSTNSQSVI
jgi:hypothetical protein